MSVPQPTLISLGGSGGVVLTMDEVVGVGRNALSQVLDVVPLVCKCGVIAMARSRPRLLITVATTVFLRSSLSLCDARDTPLQTE